MGRVYTQKLILIKCYFSGFCSNWLLDYFVISRILQANYTKFGHTVGRNYFCPIWTLIYYPL